MLQAILTNFKSRWRPLFVTDVLFKAIAFLILAPTVSLLFRGFLKVSGRTVLADTDIAVFLLHPIGWLALLILGGGIVGSFTIELALLMCVCLNENASGAPRPFAAIRFVVKEAPRVWRMAARMVAELSLLAVPFLAAAAGIAWWLLREHDINYFLSEKPREYYGAIGIAGGVLLAFALVAIHRLLNWTYATPILVIERLAPREALRESKRRVLGRRQIVLTTLVCWAALIFALRFVVSYVIVAAAESLVTRSTSNLTMLVFCLGVMILLVSLWNLCASVLGNSTLASSLSVLYSRDRNAEKFKVPELSDAPRVAVGKLFTWPRVTAAIVILVLVMGWLGVTMLHGIRLDDDVQITAHRGGAFAAPENTLAAIEQGIRDGADWIEIDVQESQDGVVMVVHDSDLKKVAGNAVKIWEATAEELRAINIAVYFDKDRDERMPTLDEVLKVCKGRAGVIIELKYYGHDMDLERKCVEIVAAHDMGDETAFMSLKASGIAKVKKLRPKWKVGLLTAVAAGDLSRADADFLALKDSLATPPLVKAVQQQGRTVSVWTPNDAHTMSLMMSRGVDNIITDRVVLARQVVKQRAQMSPVERLAIEVAFYLGVTPKQQPGDRLE